MKANIALFFGAFICVFSLSANAAHKNYGVAGCGWGSEMMGASGSQISAGTTNSFAYNQFWAISSGTSNCVPDSSHSAQMQQERFIAGNLSTLSKEMSQGSGETLAAFTKTLGCQDEVTDKVALKLKKSYEKIFKAPGAVAILETAKADLREDAELAQQCQYII